VLGGRVGYYVLEFIEGGSADASCAGGNRGVVFDLTPKRRVPRAYYTMNMNLKLPRASRWFPS
jgi:hypothetical protein